MGESRKDWKLISYSGKLVCFDNIVMHDCEENVLLREELGVLDIALKVINLKERIENIRFFV